MSTSSAHADSEEAFFLWQIEPLGFNNIEKKNGRDRAGGKAETKRQRR